MTCAWILAAALALGGCVTAPHPHTTLHQVDPAGPRYHTPACQQAVAEARAYDEGPPLQRTVFAMMANAVVPWAGTIGGAAANARLDQQRRMLNQRVVEACTG